MTDEQIVTVHLLERDKDGRVYRLGNSHECFVSEAVGLIERDEAVAIHLGCSRGVVPDGWKGGNVAVAAEAEEADGGSR